MDEKKRLTLEQLIAARDKKEAVMTRVEEFEIPSLDGTLAFKCPSDPMLFDMINALAEDQSMERITDEMAKVIYGCCDQLHDQELYEALEVGDPVNVVFEIMGAGDIIQVGDKVCSMNPLYSEIEDQVKNA